jgi:hypothetical protein
MGGEPALIKKTRLFMIVAGAATFLFVLPAPKNEAQIMGALLPVPEKRLFMSLAWAQQLPDAKAAADYAAACKERGLNGCGMQIIWSTIEPEEGKFTWEWLDERLDALVNAGLRVHLRLAIYRQLPEWLKPVFMCGSDGAVLDLGRPPRSAKQVSFADRETMAYIARAMHAVMEHVMAHYQHIAPHPIVAILSQHNASAETEYVISTWSDFSPGAQEDFRTWLRETRFPVGKSGVRPAGVNTTVTPPETAAPAGLDELNNSWGTHFKEWNQITLQAAPVFDFHAYRTYALARFIQLCADSVHAVPGARLAVQFGSVWDDFSLFRGTRDVRTLIESADLVMVDDSPVYNFAFSMDYLRGQAWDKIWGNEIDGPNNPFATNERFLQQGTVSAQRGVRLLFAANWQAKSLRDRQQWTFWGPVTAELAKLAAVQPSQAIVVSVATLFHQQPGRDRIAEELVLVHDLYQQLSCQGKEPVDFLTDAVLISHPERIKEYPKGLYLPASQVWMTDALVAALSSAPVPVYMEGKDAGLMDEYGRPRAQRPKNWKMMVK